MGNCTVSKLGGGDEEEPVSFCRERMHHLKSAVERRKILADAYERYIHSIHAIAGAINLFVACHSSTYPDLIPLRSSSPPSSSSDPSLLQQTSTEPKTEALACRSSVSSSNFCAPSINLSEEREGERYFFAELPLDSASEMEEYGWDFFNPFKGLTAAVMMGGGLGRSTAEDLRVVREHEGIPELEEELVQNEKRDAVPVTIAVEAIEREEKTGIVVESEEGGGTKIQARELAAMVAAENKMELLDALKDVEEEFLKVYDSGKDLARMLEVVIMIDHHQPRDNQIKENSSKLVQAKITWHRSLSTLSSSTSSLALNRKSNLLSEDRGELFDDCGGMESGSHLQTLGRLYAWEKKLYGEVKAGEQTRQIYQKKCLQVRNHDIKESGSCSLEKSLVAAKDLHARIWVALRTIETISIRIQKVQDNELHPQLIELLQGLMRTWRLMLQSHRRQKQLMINIRAVTCPSYGKYCSDSQHQVTKKLEEQVENWLSCFRNYSSAQKAYIDTLNGWYSKFFIADTQYYSRNRSKSSALPYRQGSPPLLSILREWSSLYGKLPDRSVILSMKGFINNLRVLLVKQGEEQQQKRKIDNLAKGFDMRIATLQKADIRHMEFKLVDVKLEPEIQDGVEYLVGRNNLVDIFRQNLEAENVKHQNCMQETTEAALNGFKFGLGHIFDSLAEFCKDSMKLYAELLALNERAVAESDAVAKKASSTEDSEEEVNVR